MLTGLAVLVSITTKVDVLRSDVVDMVDVVDPAGSDEVSGCSKRTGGHYLSLNREQAI